MHVEINNVIGKIIPTKPNVAIDITNSKKIVTNCLNKICNFVGTGLSPIFDTVVGINKGYKGKPGEIKGLFVQGRNGIGNIGGDLGVDIPIYDALANLSKELEEKMGKAKEQLKEILPIIEAIGVALLSWKISSSVLDFLSKWGMTDVKTLSKLAGLTMIIGSVVWDFKSS